LRADKGFVRALADPGMGWLAYAVALVIGLAVGAILLAILGGVA
jgi:hypothetical protein